MRFKLPKQRLGGNEPVRQARWLGRHARHFARSEDGSLIVFAVYVFLIILMFGGIGIDLMRFERDRANLQYTMDRAVLAAADLDQTLDPETVVRDYLAKAGMSDFLTSVTVDEGLSYRTVSASASSTIATQFMHMTGVDTLTAPAASTAEERIDGVEISLVLDVSGSMNSNSRLTNLKAAARDFVDTMADNTKDGDMSISIVPYATQVSTPAAFLSKFNVTQEQTYSNCVNFESSDFDTTAIDTSAELKRTMHFDPWHTYDGRSYDPKRLVSRPVCEDAEAREMVVLQKDRETLKTFISNLSAQGNTSIDIGMKWGAALLDPSLNPVVTGLIGEGTVSPDFSARPEAFASGATLKVIVLMTDGQNTSQYYVEDEFRAGDSTVWWNDQEEKYSVYFGLDSFDEDRDGITDEPRFFWPWNDSWNDHAYGNGTYEETHYEKECESYKRNGRCRRYTTVETTITVSEPGSAEILTYGELWARTSLAWNAKNNYPWSMASQAWNDWYYGAFNDVNSTTKDTRTKAICDAAKAEGIIVFTIGFEAPWSGLEVLKDCASSSSHFFDVEGLEISDAFASIASSIRKLRLTQ
ncbi:pilus assembly protein [Antarcticimicrobium luteum]|uniref:TadE/TadG family protein n=1 Tax=Antarcticimicrobium luteum TaxID=2547397 RepID=A0A4V3ASP8_9RHOB|nr:pilus assembly protein [Antarcticimicrobium luteum]TDK51590.1 TadE/TadG family protein [Antarcticimicrobium luteum]